MKTIAILASAICFVAGCSTPSPDREFHLPYAKVMEGMETMAKRYPCPPPAGSIGVHSFGTPVGSEDFNTDRLVKIELGRDQSGRSAWLAFFSREVKRGSPPAFFRERIPGELFELEISEGPPKEGPVTRLTVSPVGTNTTFVRVETWRWSVIWGSSRVPKLERQRMIELAEILDLVPAKP